MPLGSGSAVSVAAETPGEGSTPPKKNADLKARTLSAIVMVAVAGTALWLGGIVWSLFVLAVSVGVLWEWNRLARAIAESAWARLLWLVAGVAYVGVAGEMLLLLRADSIQSVALPVLAVVLTDIGAYFAGRTFGGPKIAPKISPSKTWSGLLGGAFGAFAVLCYHSLAAYMCFHCSPEMMLQEKFAIAANSLVGGALIAIIAQTGDFFESWMKRRAGVKDSGNLIPGHGGLFDRVDGLLAVLFVAGVLSAVGKI